MSKKRRRQKKKKRHPVAKRKTASGKQPPRDLRLSSYNITFEPLEDLHILPPEVEEQNEALYFLAQEKPKEAIPRLEHLREKYPNVPILYNYLARAYSAIGETEKVDALVIESYRKNPDYLFAKLNYAEICLQKGAIEMIPEIFNKKYDLKMLYPERDTFHVSEVIVFMGVMGRYFFQIGEFELAKAHCDVLRELAPEDELTIRLSRALQTSSIITKIKQTFKKDLKN